MWPENWDVLALYRKLSNQWRFGSNGPVAFDMTTFFHELDRKKLPDDLYDEYVWKLGVIEQAALYEMRR